MSVENMAEFDLFCAPLIGLPVSHIWRGYGSAIFVEFGVLTPLRRRNGSEGNPIGEWTLMIEWSWRIEGKRLIWCGSWSDEERWPRAFRYLVGSTAASVSLVGRLPEIHITLANGLHIVSAMTAEGDPEWGLMHRRGEFVSSVRIRSGRLHFEERQDARRRLGSGSESMNIISEDLMKGLAEVDSYLAGKREGYRAHVPADIGVVDALLPGSVEE